MYLKCTDQRNANDPNYYNNIINVSKYVLIFWQQIVHWVIQINTYRLFVYQEKRPPINVSLNLFINIKEIQKCMNVLASVYIKKLICIILGEALFY